jgi:hypothetical protein
MSRLKGRQGAIGAKGFYFRPSKRRFDFAFSDAEDFSDFVLASTELDAKSDDDGYALVSRPYIRFGFWHGQVVLREAWVDSRNEERGLSATVSLDAEQYICDYVRQDEDHISIRLSRAKEQRWPQPEMAQRNMPWMKHALALSNGMLDGSNDYNDEFLAWWNKQRYLEIFLRDAISTDARRLWMLEQTLNTKILRSTNVATSTPNESGHNSASPNQSSEPTTPPDPQAALTEPHVESEHAPEQPEQPTSAGDDSNMAEQERERLRSTIQQTFDQGIKGEIRRVEALCSLQHLSLSESKHVYVQTLRELATESSNDEDVKDDRAAEDAALEPD